jgi:two-component system LytT family sensor kinase
MSFPAVRLHRFETLDLAWTRGLRKWSPWLLGFGLWTLLGLLSAMQSAIFYAREGRPTPWAFVLIDRLADWYTCGVFTPLFFWLARSFPIDRQSWTRAVPVNLAVILACVPLKYLLYVSIMHRLAPGYRDRAFDAVLIQNFISETMAFAAIVGIVHAIELDKRGRQRAQQAARLETLLAEARLEALTAQLQPHFLFNTLHSVSTLMHRDVESADTMLARLGDLLRYTLDSRGRPEHSLADELRVLDSYVDIMRMRFGDRLTVQIDVPPDAAGGRVPRFILQPLVENAMQHGIGNRPGPGRISIEAQRLDDRLRITVADDGAGQPGRTAQIAGNAFPREGIGLSNTRARLSARFGDDHDLQLSQSENGGLVVTLTIPFLSADV